MPTDPIYDPIYEDNMKNRVCSGNLGAHNKVCYVGCGANGLNSAANAFGGGIDCPPKNNNPTPDDIGPEYDPNDTLPYSKTADKIKEAVEAAKEEAAGECYKDPKCCKRVSVVVECGSEFSAVEKKLGGSLCGKTFSYDCKSGKWSE